MKKSQFLLGMCTSALAIAGTLATKASRKDITHLVGWTSSSGAVCHRLGHLLVTTIQHNGSQTARTAAGAKTLYTATGAVGATVCGKKCYTGAWN